MVVLEYLHHKRIDRTADDKVHVRFQAILIPMILNIAVHRRIDVEKLLKFIDDQREPFRLSLLHQECEYILKRGHGRHENTQLVGDFLTITRTQRRFVLSSDEQINERFIVQRFADKRCLADTAAARYDRQPRMVVVRQIAYFMQLRYFGFSIVEFHVSIILCYLCKFYCRNKIIQ